MREVMAKSSTVNADGNIQDEQDTDFQYEERSHSEDRPPDIEVGEREDDQSPDQCKGDPAARHVEIRIINKRAVSVGAEGTEERGLEESVAPHHQPACLECRAFAQAVTYPGIKTSGGGQAAREIDNGDAEQHQANARDQENQR